MKRDTRHSMFTLLAALALLAMLTSFAQAAPAVDRTGWPKEVTLVGSSPTGTYTVFCTLIAELIRKHLGIKATGIPGGSGPGCAKLLRKEAEGLLIANQSGYDSSRGLGVFKRQGKANFASVFAGQGMSYSIVVRADSGITAPSQMRGKRFIGGNAGSTSAARASDVFLKLHGMTRKDVKFLMTSTPAEGVEMMKEKQADVWSMCGGVPYAPFLELSSAVAIRFIPYKKEEIEKAMAEHPGAYMPHVIPAGTYPNQDKDVLSLGTGSMFVLRKDLPDSFVYTVIKTVFDNLDELYAGPSFMKEVSLKNATRGAVAPFHPGAIKFYKEKGLWDEKMEKRQAELIKEVGY